MPYAANEDLPRSVRSHLPAHAQDIFRSAFNHAWATYAGRDPGRIEEIAHRVAWAAVKKRYRKAGDAWVPREIMEIPPED
jgi:cation transport regulator